MSRPYRIIALIIGLIPFHLLFLKGWIALELFSYKWFNGLWFAPKNSIVFNFFAYFNGWDDVWYVSLIYGFLFIIYILYLWNRRFIFADIIENLIKKI